MRLALLAGMFYRRKVITLTRPRKGLLGGGLLLTLIMSQNRLVAKHYWLNPEPWCNHEIYQTKRSGTLRSSCGEYCMPNYGRRFVSNTKLSQIERSFLESMGEFNAGDGDRGAPKALQSKHRTQTKFDRSMVLFEQIDIWHV